MGVLLSGFVGSGAGTEGSSCSVLVQPFPGLRSSQTIWSVDLGSSLN